jgi:polyphosphate kinase
MAHESVLLAGYWVDDTDDDDPVLRRPDGSIVDTWREDYPYPDRMDRDQYENEKRQLQVELLKLQYWVEDTGQRLVVLFEGRDAAGKGGTIKRFMEHLNPRRARIVALGVPTQRERGEWYFQRYIAHLPTAGEIVLYDRSWYNRGSVEPVMGFCTPEQTEDFLEQVPNFERMLINDGIALTKFWFSVTRSEQRTRFSIREIDPVRQWKLSPTDLALLGKWDAYTAAKAEIFRRTDTSEAPWTVVRSNDKKRARLGAMRSLLTRFDYPDKNDEIVVPPDPKIVGRPADIRETDDVRLSPTPLSGAGN